MEMRTILCDVRSCSQGAGPMRLAGMAARYDRPTIITTQDRKRVVERIMPGAFRSALKRGDDVALLLNHDPNRVMARVSSGTLRLHEVSSGLAFEADLPDTGYARDAYTSVKRGDLNGCSFGFGPCDDDWDMEGVDPENERGRRLPRRSIRDFKQVSDVSVVVFPAYKGTSVEARQLPTIVEQRSNIFIPTRLVVPEVPADTAGAQFRRRQLLYLAGN